MLHIYGLLVGSSANWSTLQLGLFGIPSHASGHMGVGLTRMDVLMSSSTTACRIGCMVVADQNQVLPVFRVFTFGNIEGR